MRTKQRIAQMRERYRPSWSVRGFITKKKALGLIGVIVAVSLVLWLAISLVEYNREQVEIRDEYLRQLQENKKVLEDTRSDVEALKSDLSAKQSEIDGKDKVIAEKEQKQAELEEKIEQLTKQVTILESYGSGIGGGAREVSATDVVPANPVSGGPNAYGYGYCTWYIKNKRPDIGSYWGDAKNWYASAQAAGFATGKEARPGAIGVSFEGYAGHVVYVESVSGGNIRLTEMNGAAGWNVIGSRDAPESSFVYIYGKA